MKVKLDPNYKRLFTLEQLAQARNVIAFEKDEDEANIADYVKMAVREALQDVNGYAVEVLKAEAVTALNARIQYDGFCSNSGRMDVYITATAETDQGFIKIGFYLSDAWQISEDSDIRPRMFIQNYVKWS